MSASRRPAPVADRGRGHALRYALDELRLDAVQEVGGVGIMRVEGRAVYARALAYLGHRHLGDGLYAQELHKALLHDHLRIAHARVLLPAGMADSFRPKREFSVSCPTFQ